MKTRIIVITSHFLHNPIREILSRIKADCEIKLVTYDNFTNIPEVYDTYAADADAFLISGKIAMYAIKAVEHEIMRPMVSLDIDLAGLYKSILDLLLENRNQDLKRVVLDFLIPIGNEITADAFLKELGIRPISPLIERWINSLDSAQIQAIEEQTIQKAIHLWNQDAIDLVICQYSNIIPALEEHGIAYFYPYPSDIRLEGLIEELLCKVELEHMHANLPVVINAVPYDSELCNSDNLSLIDRYIKEFLRKNLMECTSYKSKDHCSAITTVQMMDHLTGRCRKCKLSIYLEAKLGFKVAVGYGIGINLDMVIKNALSASKEAIFAGGSFIMNEKGDLIGSLCSDNPTIMEKHYIQEVGAIAKKCSLSTITVRKVIACMKMNESDTITTQELASRLGGTIRNANRILHNMEKGGVARIAYARTTNTKGRPTKVYELHLDL